MPLVLLYIHTKKKKENNKSNLTKQKKNRKEKEEIIKYVILKFAAKTLFSSVYAEKRGIFSSTGKIKH